MAAAAADTEAHAAGLEPVPGPLLEISVLKKGVRQLLSAGPLPGTVVRNRLQHASFKSGVQASEFRDC